MKNPADKRNGRFKDWSMYGTAFGRTFVIRCEKNANPPVSPEEGMTIGRTKYMEMIPAAIPAAIAMIITIVVSRRPGNPRRDNSESQTRQNKNSDLIKEKETAAKGNAYDKCYDQSVRRSDPQTRKGKCRAGCRR